MLQPNEIQEPMGAQAVRAANLEARDALKIEEVLRRAREIHRRHGGMFGYDFEDWAQAWNELPRNRSPLPLEIAVQNGSELELEHETEVFKLCC
jgi:hypothetical protein